MTESTEQITLDHPTNKPLDIQVAHIDPTLAAEWLGTNHDNRNKRVRVIKAYARDMAAGNWGLSGDPIRFDWNGRLIDGQHRLEAVVVSGTTISSVVIRGLPPEIRDVIDTGAKRSPADALRFEGHTYDPMQLAAIARIAIAREHHLLTNALSSNPPSATNAEVIAWADAHPEVEHALALARRTAGQVGVQPSVWGYFLWEAQRIDGPAAVEFATSTADKRTEGKGDPRYALLDIFHRAALGRRRKPTTAEAIYVCFRAWNAWVNRQGASAFIAIGKDGHGNAIPALESPARIRRAA